MCWGEKWKREREISSSRVKCYSYLNQASIYTSGSTWSWREIKWFIRLMFALCQHPDMRKWLLKILYWRDLILGSFGSSTPLLANLVPQDHMLEEFSRTVIVLENTINIVLIKDALYRWKEYLWTISIAIMASFKEMHSSAKTIQNRTNSSMSHVHYLCITYIDVSCW